MGMIKTTVRKHHDHWYVNFYWPYAGPGYSIFENWRDAVDTAFALERERPFA